jgi:hypothetical protein
MLKKLRSALAEVEGQKFKHFDDFQKIIKRIHREYGNLFPQFKENKDGSHYVYHFGMPGVFPISLVKEHGPQEHIPPKFAKRAIQGIEDVLTFIEENIPDDLETESEEEGDDEYLTTDQEATGTLPEPKIPDGDRRG